MKTSNIFVFLLVMIASSCELTKEIDYHTFYKNDKLIVYGFVSPQSGVQAIIKKSVAPNNVLADDRIQDAKVTLYEDEIDILQLKKIDDYHYGSDSGFKPIPGKAYSAKISVDGFEEVSSNPQVLFAPVSIDSLKIIIEEGTNYTNLVVWFTNNIQFDGSYYIKVYPYLGGVDDPSSSDNKLFNPYGIIENIVVGKNSVEQPIYDNFDSIIVELYCLSPDLTKFLESYHNYESTKEDPFFEKTYLVFSNIKNGYGIFATYNVSSKTILKQ